MHRSLGREKLLGGGDPDNPNSLVLPLSVWFFKFSLSCFRPRNVSGLFSRGKAVGSNEPSVCDWPGGAANISSASAARCIYLMGSMRLESIGDSGNMEIVL